MALACGQVPSRMTKLWSSVSFGILTMSIAFWEGYNKTECLDDSISHRPSCLEKIVKQQM